METAGGSRICSVCGDCAVSCNFGAMSCESCKAFFRRNASLQKTLLCPYDGNCQLTVRTRKYCASCRLRKCFEVWRNGGRAQDLEYLLRCSLQAGMTTKSLAVRGNKRVTQDQHLQESDMAEHISKLQKRKHDVSIQSNSMEKADNANIHMVARPAQTIDLISQPGQFDHPRVQESLSLRNLISAGQTEMTLNGDRIWLTVRIPKSEILSVIHSNKVTKESLSTVSSPA